MNLTFSLPVWLLLFSALFALAISLFVFTRRSAPGSVSLGVTALTIAVWSFAYAWEIAAQSLPLKIFWAQVEYLGIAFLPYSWLLFSLAYTLQGRPSRRLQFAHLLAVFPLVTVILAFTNDSHHLLWRQTFFKPVQNFTVLGVTYGAWFWAHFIFSYLALLGGTLLVLRSLWQARGLYRRQTLALFFAALLPWVGNALYFAGINPDPTPFLFDITLVLLVWAIFGYRLVDIAPIARDLVLDGMREGLLVLDLQGRIVDINAAAARFVGLPAEQAVGRPAIEALRPWAALLERFREVTEASEVIEVGSGETLRKLGVRISPLRDERQNLLGRLISFWELDSAPAAGPLPQAQTAFETPEFHPQEEPVSSTQGGFWQGLETFFSPPLRVTHSAFFSSVRLASLTEQVFTASLRIIVLLFSLSLALLSLFSAIPTSTRQVMLVLLLLAWVDALFRQIPFALRILAFLASMYALMANEILNFGFTPDAYAFALGFVALSVLLAEARGGWMAFVLALLTLGFIGTAIANHSFVPFLVTDLDNLLPASLLTLPPLLLSFSAISIGIIVAVSALLNSLTRSWQEETQARTLLQQERDLLEQRVRERTEELRKYFQVIHQGGNSIVITDPQGAIEYVNPFFEKVTGYRAAEVLGSNPRLLKSGRQPQDFYRRMWETITSGQVWRGEFQNRRKDGSLYWEFATIAPVTDENAHITHFVAVKEDVSAQKELQETLARQNEYLSTLQNVTLDLLEHTEPQELLNNILTRAQTMLQSPMGAVLLWENDTLVYRAVTEQRSGKYGLPASRQEMPLAWEALETRRPAASQDYTRYFGPRPIDQGAAPLRAAVDFPILAGSQTLGVIALGRDDERPYSPSELEFGQSLAQIAALVLENATLYANALRELEERKRIQANLEIREQEQSALADLLVAGVQEEDTSGLLDRALLQLLGISWLGIEAKGGIFLADPTKQTLTLAAQRNLAAEICTRCALVSFGECLCGRAALTRQLQFSSHVDERHEITYQGMADHGHYNIPVLAEDEVLGVIVLYLLPGYQQNERDVAFLNAYASTLSNILRRKQVIALLRESEIRFRQIVENASDIIYRMDESGCMTYVNPVGLRLFGYEMEEDVLGKHFTEFAIPAWRSKIKAFYKRQALQAQENTYYEFVAQTRNGNELWLGQNVQLIRAGKRISGFQAVARDITQLKKTQDALAYARDQALEASRLKSQLLAKVSHELRTPLGGVIGYAELLQQGAFGSLQEEQQDAADNIVGSANYLNAMINELLDQAQIEARSVRIFKESFSPAHLLESAASSLRVLALGKGLEFRSDLDPQLPLRLWGDERRLQQILINLGGNAIKFTSQGQVSLSLRIDSASATWQMQVQDTGIGIPIEAQTYIFDPFRQVENAATRSVSGTGLGLSITKQLVELMGGFITLQSDLGKGSLFTVTLPLELPPGS